MRSTHPVRRDKMRLVLESLSPQFFSRFFGALLKTFHLFKRVAAQNTWKSSALYAAKAQENLNSCLRRMSMRVNFSSIYFAASSLLGGTEPLPASPAISRHHKGSDKSSCSIWQPLDLQWGCQRRGVAK